MLAAVHKDSPAQLLWDRIHIYWFGSLNEKTVDFATLVKLRRGHTEAQEQYLAAFWSTLENEVRHYARRGGDPDELHQEAALALWEAAFQYQPTQHRTTVEAFVRNHIHRKVRKFYLKSIDHRDQLLPNSSEEHGPHPIVRQDLSLVDMRLDLHQALVTLSPREKSISQQFLQLAVSNGMGIEDAARYLADSYGGTPAKWKKTIQRLRAKWKRHMQWG